MSIRIAIVVLLSVLLGACLYWPGGSDPAGSRIKAEMEPVVSAARAYRAKYGAYPTSLDRLVPEFTASLPSRVALQYNAAEGSIGFIYSPSLWRGSVARCRTAIEKIEWVCSDYKL
ncbi:MAG: hypothetical protein PSX71_12260 [bacterium]|nr:hypothetical protein [bacterium]